jgi:hypothetical protein
MRKLQEMGTVTERPSPVQSVHVQGKAPALTNELKILKILIIQWDDLIGPYFIFVV